MSDTFKEETAIINGKVTLKGTLAIPEGFGNRRPAVLLIAGSGPVDRNGNAPKAGLVANIYRDLAKYMTSLGFATLRYDKRGVGESGGDFYKTGMWDLVDDISACVRFLKDQPAVDPDRIILLGHSEGCMLATVYNAREPVAGMILLAGAAETLEQATKRQRELAYAELLGSKGFKGFLYRMLKIDKKGEAQNEKLREKILNSPKDVMKINLVKLNAKWFREHYQYDVVADLKKAACPVLAVTGSVDCQANPEKLGDVPSLVRGESECHIIENMDHVLKAHKGSRSILKIRDQYKAEAGDPLHPELLKVLAGWLGKFANIY